MGTRARTNAALLGSASAGAILSTVATVVQTALILATTSPPTLAHLVLPLVCAGSMAMIYGVIFMVLALREPLPEKIDRGRPVNVRVALLFAATLTVVLVVSAALDAWFGRAGLVAAALVAGFADAHAPVASAASLVASGRVPDRISAFFGGDVGTMPVLMMVGNLGIERDVEISLSPKPGYPGYRLLDVSWRAKNGGPYPVFHGTLSIADEGAGWSRIDLDGTYKPPFGLVGASFDVALGHRVAVATASELLAQFRRGLGGVRT